MRIHHIGYYVPNIDKAVLGFKALGYYAEGNKTSDSERGINVLFINNGHIRIELIEKNSEKSDVDYWANGNGAIPYHICYEVSDVDKEIKELKKQKFIVIKKKNTAIALDNREVVFMYSKYAGFVELLDM